MNNIFILTILIVGFSGIVAQVLLLRELLVSFYGNELTIGVILANWVVSEALGVFIAGKFIERVKNKINFFISLEVIFILVFAVSVYLSRAFSGLLGLPFGVALGLFGILSSSFFIILPVSFCHGALFSAGCKIYSLYIKKTTASVGRVYTWESLGTIIGGLAMTYLLISRLNSFQIVFLVAILNLAACSFLLRGLAQKRLKYIIFAAIILLSFLNIGDVAQNLERISLAKQWRLVRLLDYQNSIYGNVAVTKESEQYTFFYNGTPVITAPYPDRQFVEEFGNLPLLFHPKPKDILVVSAGAGGLISEVLKHPIRKIDYVELDPLIIEMLKKYPTSLTEAELKNKKVRIINTDARFFIRTTPNLYDVILIGLSKPADLSTNRLFTKDFFSLVKAKLNQGGILALWLPGSLTYISRELSNINFSILNALKESFGYVRVIPGDYNIFLASGSKDVLEVAPGLISERINQENIKTNILIPGYLNYRLSKTWLEWFSHATKGATLEVNRDFKPVAVFQMLKIINKKFSPRLSHVMDILENLNLKAVSVFIFVITLLLLYLNFARHQRNLSITYAIATTGFFGMLANLILIFSFQVFYGYLYHMIGALISIFMAGIAAGSIFMTARVQKIKRVIELFIGLEALIGIFSVILAIIITKFLGTAAYTPLVFTILLFISGLLMGLEFPLASKICLRETQETGRVSGLLYASDLMGGWLAGIVGGVILLPILGLFDACMVMLLFKLSSIILLIASKKSL